ncbi:MAG: hypothetical protein JO256_02135 [Alphaproteobacteria bacterium]|nr:hypothetical protein [Alphaproteobacteria bacterium]
MGAFPLLLFPLVFYNLLAFGGGLAGRADVAALLNEGFGLTLPSGDVWHFSYSDLFVALSLCLLFLEMVKATRTGRAEILNHAFSTLTFVAALMEFLLLKGFATTAFFLLTAMTLFDVVAGYTISIISARRDLTVPEHD